MPLKASACLRLTDLGARCRGHSLKSRARIQEEARFKILRLLHDNPKLSQRDLGQLVGISLGAVNYCLRALIDRGLVKAGGFSRNPNKLAYAYVLTPAGIAEKTLLTGRFLKRKIEEYAALKAEIEALSLEASISAHDDDPLQNRRAS